MLQPKIFPSAATAPSGDVLFPKMRTAAPDRTRAAPGQVKNPRQGTPTPPAGGDGQERKQELPFPFDLATNVVFGLMSGRARARETKATHAGAKFYDQIVEESGERPRIEEAGLVDEIQRRKAAEESAEAYAAPRPVTKGAMRAGQKAAAGDWKGVIDEVIGDPFGTLAYMASESAAQDLLAPVVSFLPLAGPYAATYSVERRAGIAEGINEAIRERGGNPANPDDVFDALSDKELLIEITKREEKAARVGAATETWVELLTLGATRSIPRPFLRAIIQLGSETIGEAAGEVSRQHARGEGVNLAEAFLEGLAAAGQSIATTVGTETIRRADVREVGEEVTAEGFAGPRSKTADKSQLKQAKKLDAQGGFTSEDIRKETGWFVTPEGQWRYEIPDDELELDAAKWEELPEAKSVFQTGVRSVPITDVIQHDKVFEAYPQAKNIRIVKTDFGMGDASYNPSANFIEVEKDLSRLGPEEVKRAIVHELQHAIQNYEGIQTTQEIRENPYKFATDNVIREAAGPQQPGESREQWARRAQQMDPVPGYRALYDEVEARATEDRMELTEEERRGFPPFLKETVPEGQWITDPRYGRRPQPPTGPEGTRGGQGGPRPASMGLDLSRMLQQAHSHPFREKNLQVARNSEWKGYQNSIRRVVSAAEQEGLVGEELRPRLEEAQEAWDEGDKGRALATAEQVLTTVHRASSQAMVDQAIADMSPEERAEYEAFVARDEQERAQREEPPSDIKAQGIDFDALLERFGVPQGLSDTGLIGPRGQRIRLPAEGRGEHSEFTGSTAEVLRGGAIRTRIDQFGGKTFANVELSTVPTATQRAELNSLLDEVDNLTIEISDGINPVVAETFADVTPGDVRRFLNQNREALESPETMERTTLAPERGRGETQVEGFNVRGSNLEVDLSQFTAQGFDISKLAGPNVSFREGLVRWKQVIDELPEDTYLHMTTLPNLPGLAKEGPNLSRLGEAVGAAREAEPAGVSLARDPDLFAVYMEDLETTPWARKSNIERLGGNEGRAVVTIKFEGGNILNMEEEGLTVGEVMRDIGITDINEFVEELGFHEAIPDEHLDNVTEETLIPAKNIQAMFMSKFLGIDPNDLQELYHNHEGLRERLLDKGIDALEYKDEFRVLRPELLQPPQEYIDKNFERHPLPPEAREFTRAQRFPGPYGTLTQRELNRRAKEVLRPAEGFEDASFLLDDGTFLKGPQIRTHEELAALVLYGIEDPFSGEPEALGIKDPILHTFSEELGAIRIASFEEGRRLEVDIGALISDRQITRIVQAGAGLPHVVINNAATEEFFSVRFPTARDLFTFFEEGGTRLEGGGIQAQGVNINKLFGPEEEGRGRGEAELPERTVYETADEEARLIPPPTEEELGEVAGLSKVLIARTREKLGLQQIPDPERKGHMTALRAAVRKGYHQPAKALEISRRLSTGRRPITQEEVVGLNLAVAQLEQQHDQWMARAEAMVDAGRPEDTISFREQADQVNELIDNIEMGARVSITEAARALAALGTGFDTKTLTLSRVRREAKVNRGRALNETEETQLRDAVRLLRRAEENEKKALGRIADADQTALENLAKEGLVTEAKKAQQAARQEGYAQRIEAIRNERAELLKDLGRLGFRVQSSFGLDPQAAFIIAKIARTYVQEGVVGLDNLVNKIKDHLPDLKREDIIEGIAMMNAGEQRAAERHARQKLSEAETVRQTLRDFAKLQRENPDQAKKLLNQLHNYASRNISDEERLTQIYQQIDAIRAKLDAGVQAPKEKPRTPPSPEVRAALDELRDMRRLLRTEQTIADLHEQIETGNFKEKPERRREVETPVTKELKQAQVRLAQARREVRRLTKGPTPWDPKKDIFVEPVRLFRQLMTTGEMSGTLRQGLPMIMAQPTKFPQHFRKAFAAFFKSDVADEIEFMIQTSTRQPLLQEMGVQLTYRQGLNEREELFMSKILERTPAMKELLESNHSGVKKLLLSGPASVKSVVNAAERHMTTFLNLYRMSIAEQAIEQYGTEDMETLKQIGKLINDGSGRGNFKTGPGTVASVVLFAPRFTVSRFSAPARSLVYLKNPKLRKQIAGTWLKTAIWGASWLGFAHLAGINVGTDPEDSDFGKIVWGNTRIDVWGGFQQSYTWMMRMALAGKKLILDERILGKEIEGPRPDPYRLATNFGLYKSSPLVTTPLTLLSGRTPIGESVTATELLAKSTIPLFLQDAYETGQRTGWLGGAGVLVGTGLGLNINTFGSEMEAGDVKPIWNQARYKPRPTNYPPEIKNDPDLKERYDFIFGALVAKRVRLTKTALEGLSQSEKKEILQKYGREAREEMKIYVQGKVTDNRTLEGLEREAGILPNPKPGSY